MSNAATESDCLKKYQIGRDEVHNYFVINTLKISEILNEFITTGV